MLVAASVALAAVMVVWRGVRLEPEGWLKRGAQLPVRMPVEEIVENLSAKFDREVVLAEAAHAQVHVGSLEPRYRLHMTGGWRQAIVAPAPSRLRFRTIVPAGAVLRFGVGVEGNGKRDAEAAGVRFAVSVDGREVFARVVNPAASRHDRRWFDERVDLGTTGDRESEILLTTRRVGGGSRLAGTPGWSHLRVVRETSHDRQPAEPAAPNVLLLLIDTLRADSLGCYGATPSPSPNLDRLAQEGLLFNEAVSQAPWTLPSVATILTGLYPRSHGASGGLGEVTAESGEEGTADAAYLPGALRTLAGYAQVAGITTVGVTSNPLVSRGTNLARGFETFVELPWDSEGAGWPSAEEINNAFLRWLRQNSRYRFFGYLHYMDVHSPYDPPEGYRPARPDGIRELVARGDVMKIKHKSGEGSFPPLAPRELEHLRQLYDAQLSYWDAQLARLLDGLAAAGVVGSTVLVVMSDHGEEFLEHGNLAHSKRLYDELLRVPLIITGPGIGRGPVAAQVQGIDILPTVAALLDFAVPPDLPGHNILDAPKGRPVISEAGRHVEDDGVVGGTVSVRTPAWKLIHGPAPSSFELYDLRRDPAERENRHGEAPEGATLARLLADWQARIPLPPAAAGRDPKLRDKLRALGYVE